MVKCSMGIYANVIDNKCLMGDKHFRRSLQVYVYIYINIFLDFIFLTRIII